MTYESLYRDFLDFLPEKSEEIKNCMAKVDVEPDEGMHIVFGEVIVLLMIKWVKEKDPVVQKAFEFIETMAMCNDKQISEVLDFTILESFADQEPEVYAAIKEQLEPNTEERCKAIEEYILQS